MDYSKLLSEFYTGDCFHAYQYFGAHPAVLDGKDGVWFRVYAPNAQQVQLIGECNGWDGALGEMAQMGKSGVFSVFMPGARPGQMYKYRISQSDGRVLDRSDPYGFSAELRPHTASVVTDIDAYRFSDEAWVKRRGDTYNRPMNIYEMHMGSWRRKDAPEEAGWYRYDELCGQLVKYLKENRFTHVEFLPLSEYPFDGSWGYQVSGFYSATSRYGTPEELMRLIDCLHQNGIGVILDFVPVHFVVNDYALSRFDGSALYEYPDSDTGYSEWGSCNFNYYRGEVCSFLQSAANFWIEKYHVDGLRVDAVSNALYWQGDCARGVNAGAVGFLKKMNKGLHRLHNGILMIAEDSSNFPKVTAPVEYGGLGFDYKWNMGWMNDTLKFFEQPFANRRALYHQITFSMDYFYNELYLLPLSHDEVVHGKKTVLDKMYGAYEEKFAQARLLYTYMYTHPGKKLNFMGNELGQFREWDESTGLDWNLLEYPMHDGFYHYFRELGRLYEALPALYEKEYNSENFRWVGTGARKGCVYAYLRGVGKDRCLVLLNAGNTGYEKLKVKLDSTAEVKELLNSDETRFGGEGRTNPQPLRTEKIEDSFSLTVRLAPLSAAIFKL